MTFLDHLTPDQRSTLVSLPYRVGLWVSGSDISGGDDAHQQEMRALANIIHGFAEEMFGSESMQHIMSETLSRKNQWVDWAGQVASVPADCAYAVDVLKEYAEPKDVNVFRNHLMEIGEAVAMAFRENRPRGERLKAWLPYMASRMKKNRGRLHNRSFQDYLRISVHEHKALAALAKALGATY